MADYNSSVSSSVGTGSGTKVRGRANESQTIHRQAPQANKARKSSMGPFGKAANDANFNLMEPGTKGAVVTLGIFHFNLAAMSEPLGIFEDKVYDEL